MSTPIKIDDFLSAQGSGFTATLETIPDRQTHVKVTPYQEGTGCACSMSFQLPREMISSVTPTGKYHFCCGKRLEVVVIAFAENASVPVTELMQRLETMPSHPAPAIMPSLPAPVINYRSVYGAYPSSVRPGLLPVGSVVSLDRECLGRPTFSAQCATQCMGLNEYNGYWYCIPTICCHE